MRPEVIPMTRRLMKSDSFSAAVRMQSKISFRLIWKKRVLLSVIPPSPAPAAATQPLFPLFFFWSSKLVFAGKKCESRAAIKVGNPYNYWKQRGTLKKYKLLPIFYFASFPAFLVSSNGSVFLVLARTSVDWSAFKASGRPEEWLRQVKSQSSRAATWRVRGTGFDPSSDFFFPWVWSGREKLRMCR